MPARLICNAAWCVTIWLTLSIAALLLLRRHPAAIRRAVCRLGLLGAPAVLGAAIGYGLYRPAAGVWVGEGKVASAPAAEVHEAEPALSALAVRVPAPRAIDWAELTALVVPGPLVERDLPATVPTPAAAARGTAPVAPGDDPDVRGRRNDSPACVARHLRYRDPAAETLHDPAAATSHDPAAETSGHGPKVTTPLTSRRWWRWVLIGLAAGSAVVAASLVTRLIRLRRWQRSWRPAAPAWMSLAGRLARRIGLARPFAVMSARGLSAPAATGVLRLVVVLPVRRSVKLGPGVRAVLAHELGHLAGRDPLWQMIGNVVLVLTWWCPLTWWLLRAQHIESELTADDFALAAGARPASLAKALVRLARAGAPAPAPVAVSGMACHLKRRIAMMLNDTRLHTPRLRCRTARMLVAGACILIAAIVATPLVGVAQVGGRSERSGRHRRRPERAERPEENRDEMIRRTNALLEQFMATNTQFTEAVAGLHRARIALATGKGTEGQVRGAAERMERAAGAAHEAQQKLLGATRPGEGEVRPQRPIEGRGALTPSQRAAEDRLVQEYMAGDGAARLAKRAKRAEQKLNELRQLRGQGKATAQQVEAAEREFVVVTQQHRRAVAELADLRQLAAREREGRTEHPRHPPRAEAGRHELDAKIVLAEGVVVELASRVEATQARSGELANRARQLAMKLRELTAERRPGKATEQEILAVQDELRAINRQQHDTRQALVDATAQLREAQRHLNELRQRAEQLPQTDRPDHHEEALRDLARRIEEAEREYRQLRRQFGEDSPKVAPLRRRLAEMVEQHRRSEKESHAHGKMGQPDRDRKLQQQLQQMMALTEQIAANERALRQLRGTHGDNHPMVLAVKRRLAEHVEQNKRAEKQLRDSWVGGADGIERMVKDLERAFAGESVDGVSVGEATRTMIPAPMDMSQHRVLVGQTERKVIELETEVALAEVTLRRTLAAHERKAATKAETDVAKIRYEGCKRLLESARRQLADLKRQK